MTAIVLIIIALVALYLWQRNWVICIRCKEIFPKRDTHLDICHDCWYELTKED